MEIKRTFNPLKNIEFRNGYTLAVLGKFVYFFIDCYLCSLLLMTSSVLASLLQETAFSEAKTKVSHKCGLNYILLRFYKMLTSAS